MKIVPSQCANCCAPVEIPEGASQVKCTFCESMLLIVRTESAISTEFQEELFERLQDAAAELELQKLGAKLRALVRRWKRSRARYSKDGQFAVPTRRGSRIAITAGLILLVLALVNAFVGPAVFFPALVFLGLVTFIGGLVMVDSADRYRKAHKKS